jgi:DNA-binding winged helix-turn-helix (wHTH) protein/Tol biopolymer transport system component
MLPDPADLQFGSFRLSLRERRLLQNGQEVPLTPKAFDTLQFLVTNAGHLVEKQDLMKAIWGEVFVDENTLNQNIFTIRKALGDASFIENVPRRGYRFAPMVTTPEPISEPATRSLPESVPGPSVPGPSQKFAFRWIAALAAAAVVVAVWVYVGRPPSNPLDGAKFTRFTNFEGDELNGAISPDGKFVAFVSDRNGSFDNWLGEATGNPVVWSKGGTRESSRNLVRSLGFSGDGSVWNKELTGGIPNFGPLRIAPLTGGAARLFLEQDAMEPAWSADGKRLVYHTNDAGDSMYVADGTGANPKKVFGEGDAGIHRHLPAWSLDGAWIYFTRGNIATTKWDIWRIPAVGGAEERLTQHNSFVAYPNPIDERTVLYVARDENGLGPWLWALDLETKKYRRISSGTDEYIALSATANGRRLAATIAKPSASLRVVPILERIAEDGDVKAFEVPTQRAWAPRFGGGSSASESLFFLSSLGNGDGLWRYRGKELTEVWKGADGALFEPPAVSRDGERIAIALRRNGRLVWHIGPADRANLRSVGEGIDIQGGATWSPDGRFLLAGGSDANGQGLFRIPVDGGTPTRVVSGIALNPVWSPEANLIVYAGASVGLNAPLHAIGPDGATVKFPSIQVDGFGAQPGRFLPDGKGLVYRLGPDFWLLNLSTLLTRQLTRLGEPSLVKTFDVTPDGKQIVFDRLRRNSDIYIIDLPAKP